MGVNSPRQAGQIYMGGFAVHYNLRKAGASTVIDWTGEVGMSAAPDAREQILQCPDEGQYLLLEKFARMEDILPIHASIESLTS